MNYATATARTLGRELQFWQSRIDKKGFEQKVAPIDAVPSGYHATNFGTPKQLLEKWYNAVPGDGISMYDIYNVARGMERLQKRISLGLPPNPVDPKLMPGRLCPKQGTPFPLTK